MSVLKPPINVLLAQPSNMWPRYDTQFEFIVLHYVGADDPDLISAAETLIEQRIKEEH